MRRAASRSRLSLFPVLLVALTALPTGASGSALWSVGELPGGDIRTLAIHPADPDHLLAGTSSGQVFRSVDGGQSWHLPGSRLPFRGWVVSDLVFDPADPKRVWAALRGAWGQDGLIVVSTDGGKSWASRSDGLPGRQVYALAVAPGAVYAATRLGVWGTRNEGRSWHHLTADHPEILKVTSLLVDPADPLRIFAGTWRRAYRSDDGGTTWRGVFNGMILDSEVFSLHATPGGGGELWASTCGWVYKSANLGDSWRRYESGLGERRTPSFQILAGGGKLAGTVRGVYRSDDDGASWNLVTPEDLVVLAIEHHGARPDRIFLGTEGAGVWRSDDGGRTFRPSSHGLNAARIAALTASGSEVIAAVRHSGPASGLYSSFDGGTTYRAGPVSLPTVISLTSSGRGVLAATVQGLFERLHGEWRLVREVGERPVRQVVANGEQVVARTDDDVWVRHAGVDAFEPLDFARGEIASVAVSNEAIWIATGSGSLFRLQDGEAVAASVPLRDGKIFAAGSKLLAGNADELWMRQGVDGAWQNLGRRVTFHPTGDRDYPLLLVGADGVARLLGDAGRVDRVLGLTVPPQHLSAVLVRGQRVVLGTSGYGLLIGELGQADLLSSLEGGG